MKAMTKMFEQTPLLPKGPLYEHLTDDMLQSPGLSEYNTELTTEQRADLLIFKGREKIARQDAQKAIDAKHETQMKNSNKHWSTYRVNVNADRTSALKFDQSQLQIYDN